MFAFLLEPATWALTAGGAYLGSLFDHKISAPAQGAATGTGTNQVSIEKVMLYALGGLAIAYGYKKVFK